MKIIDQKHNLPSSHEHLLILHCSGARSFGGPISPGSNLTQFPNGSNNNCETWNWVSTQLQQQLWVKPAILQ